MRRPPWHIRWPLIALGFQLVPWLAFHLLARAVYLEPPSVSIDAERPWTLAILAASAGGSWIFGGVATYLLLRRSRPRVAIPLLLLCCVPSLLGAAFYTHAYLVFTTRV